MNKNVTKIRPYWFAFTVLFLLLQTAIATEYAFKEVAANGMPSIEIAPSYYSTENLSEPFMHTTKDGFVNVTEQTSPTYDASGNISWNGVDYWWIRNVSKNDLVLVTIEGGFFSWESKLFYSNLTEIQSIDQSETHLYSFFANESSDYLLRLRDYTFGMEYTIHSTHPVLEIPMYVISGNLSEDIVDYWWIRNVSKNDLVLVTIEGGFFSWESKLFYSNLTEIQSIDQSETHLYSFFANESSDYLLRLRDYTFGMEYTIHSTHPVSALPRIVIEAVEADGYIVAQGNSVEVHVELSNKAAFEGRIYVTIFFGSRAREIQTILLLAPEEYRSLKFMLNTSDVAVGNYTISVEYSLIFPGIDRNDVLARSKLAREIAVIRGFSNEKEATFGEWRATWWVHQPVDTGEWRGDEVGESLFPATFDFDWRDGAVYEGYKDNIGFIAVMKVHVGKTDPIFFQIGSNDGAKFFIDGNLVIDLWKDGTYRTKNTTLNLLIGEHILEFWYYESDGWARVSFTYDSEILGGQSIIGQLLIWINEHWLFFAMSLGGFGGLGALTLSVSRASKPNESRRRVLGIAALIAGVLLLSSPIIASYILTPKYGEMILGYIIFLLGGLLAAFGGVSSYFGRSKAGGIASALGGILILFLLSAARDLQVSIPFIAGDNAFLLSLSLGTVAMVSGIAATTKQFLVLRQTNRMGADLKTTTAEKTFNQSPSRPKSLLVCIIVNGVIGFSLLFIASIGILFLLAGSQALTSAGQSVVAILFVGALLLALGTLLSSLHRVRIGAGFSILGGVFLIPIFGLGFIPIITSVLMIRIQHRVSIPVLPSKQTVEAVQPQTPRAPKKAKAFFPKSESDVSKWINDREWDKVLGINLLDFVGKGQSEEKYREKLEKLRENREEWCARKGLNSSRVKTAISEAYRRLRSGSRNELYVRRTAERVFEEWMNSQKWELTSEDDKELVKKCIVQGLLKSYETATSNPWKTIDLDRLKNDVQEKILEQSSFEIGQHLSQTKRESQSIYYLKEAVKRSNNHDQLYGVKNHWLGSTLLSIGRGAEAIPYLIEAANSRATPLDYRLLALTLWNQGRKKEAVPYFEKLVQIGVAEKKEIRLVDLKNCGKALLEFQRPCDAIQSFREATTIDPYDEETRQLLTTALRLCTMRGGSIFT